MRYHEVARRLHGLERQAQFKRQAELEQLTDVELDALIAEMDEEIGPEMSAAIQALSDADLHLAWEGSLDEGEILRRYRAKQVQQ